MQPSARIRSTFSHRQSQRSLPAGGIPLHTVRTADFALEQGRDVYAIPGRITDALSAGCNSLIRQGAGAVSDLESFVQELAPDPGAGGETCTFEKLLLEKEERLVYSCVDLRPKSMEELLEETDLSVPELAQILGILLKKGFVTEAFKNCYIRRI